MSASENPDEHEFGRFAPSDVSIIGRRSQVVVFGGFRVPDPRPGSGISHAVTHDIVIEESGDVRVRVNGADPFGLPHEPNSHIS